MSYVARLCQVARQCRMSGSAGLTVAAHGNASALDGRCPQGVDDAVGNLVGYLDEGESFRDLDGADGARIDAGLVDDGPDEIRRPDLGETAGADVETRDVPLRRDALTFALP